MTQPDLLTRAARLQRGFRRHRTLYVVGVVGLGLALGLVRGPGFPPTILLIPLIWGAVLIGHWLLTRQVVDIVTQSEMAAPRYRYESVNASLRLRVEEQVRQEQRRQQGTWFRYGWITMLVSLALAWIVVPTAGGPFAYSVNSIMSSLVVFSIGSVIAMVCHWRGYRVSSESATRDLRDQVLGRLIQEEWAGEPDSEKAKRTLALSDDGELVELEDEMAEPATLPLTRKRARG
jgi:hypothetical protein